jgi:hypothetical protein
MTSSSGIGNSPRRVAESRPDLKAPRAAGSPLRKKIPTFNQELNSPFRRRLASNFLILHSQHNVPRRLLGIIARWSQRPSHHHHG